MKNVLSWCLENPDFFFLKNPNGVTHTQYLYQSESVLTLKTQNVNMFKFWVHYWLTKLLNFSLTWFPMCNICLTPPYPLPWSTDKIELVTEMPNSFWIKQWLANTRAVTPTKARRGCSRNIRHDLDIRHQWGFFCPPAKAQHRELSQTHPRTAPGLLAPRLLHSLQPFTSWPWWRDHRRQGTGIAVTRLGP